MTNFTLDEIKTEETPQEEVSLKSPKKVVKKVNYEIKKVEISKNIQKFDKKSRVHSENPFEYNSVALKKKDVRLTPSAEELVTSPLYHSVGAFLGVDTRRDWNILYNKVFEITEWAKKKSGEKDSMKLIRFINGFKNKVPTLADKNIDNLYLYAHQQLKKYGT